MSEDWILDQLPEVVSRLGPEGLEVRGQNKASLEEHGDTAGTPCYKAHFGRDSRCKGCLVDEVLQSKRTGRWFLTDDRADRPAYFEVTMVPLLDGQGNVVELIEILRDATVSFAVEKHLIQTSEELEGEVAERTRELEGLNERATELRDQLQELRQDQAALVQTEKMASLGRLAAGLTHEIHTPLGALISNLDMLRRCVTRIEEEVAAGTAAARLEALQKQTTMCGELLDLQQTASERIHKIIHSLRMFAHLDRAEEEEYDLHDGIDASLSLLAHQTKGRIEIERDYGEIGLLNCKPDAINQIFMNLLQNAVHAIEDKGKIRIRSCVRNNQIVLEVADTGKGIDPEHLEQIFDPGFTTKPRGVGTGLGLAIAYRTIQDHEGTIEVESEPGKGTTFTLRLPLGRKT